MRQGKTVTVLWVSLTVIVIMVLGWSLGDVLANQFQEFSIERTRSDKQEAILDQMGTLHIGDSLKDGTFVDLNGRERILSSIARPFILTFVRSDCGACKQEIQLLNSIPATNKDRHIFVSDGLAYDFTASSDFSPVLEQMLLDNKGEYVKVYGVFVTPFNILIGTDFRINDICTGVPAKKKIESWYEFLSHK